MSGTLPANEPACVEQASASIELLIDARPRDLGGFVVRRVLPSPMRRMVGPFIFFDHMGPTQFEPGAAFDVRPHPHIALATMTYLFDGEILHRDSLGSYQPIRPGDVNWMVAGSGIVHSERQTPEARQQGMLLHGIQCWVALPTEQEETAPRFEHHPLRSIPRIAREDVVLDVIAGTSYGQRSPVQVLSETLYVHARLESNAKLTIDEQHEQRAVYVVEGELACDGRRFGAGTLLVLKPHRDVQVLAAQPTRLMLLGGAPLAGARYIYWNFVASSQARLEQAKQDWKAQRFPFIPDDHDESIPLPEL